MKKYYFAFLMLLVVANFAMAQNENWTTYIQPTRVNDYLETDETVWIATDGGLYEIDKTTQNIERWKKENTGWPSNKIESIAIHPETHNIFVGTYDMQIVVQDGDNWSWLHYPEEFDEALTYTLEFDNMGDLWVGTNKGLLQYDGENWTVYNSSTSFGLHAVWTLEKDEEGRMWIGANALFKYEADSLYQMTSFEFSDPNHLFAYSNGYVYLHSNGDVWFFTDIGSAGRYDGTNWEIFNHNNDNALPFHNSPDFVTEDESGKLKAFTKNQGFFTYDGATWEAGPSISDLEQVPIGHYRTATSTINCYQNEIVWEHDGISNSYIMENFPFEESLYGPKTDWNNQLWSRMGSSQIIRLNGTERINLLESGFETVWFAGYYDFDTEGNCWIASGNNIVKYTVDGEWEVYNPTNSILPAQQSFNRLTVDANGDVWIYTYNYGIYHFDGTNWKKESHIGIGTEGLIDMEPGPYGDMWFLFYTYNNNTYDRLLIRFDGDNLYNETANITMENPNLLHYDPSTQSLWVAGFAPYVQSFDGANWSNLDFPVSEEQPYVTQIDVEGDRILLAVGEEILLYDGAEWDIFSPLNSPISNDQIYGTGIDEEGKLWIMHTNALEIYDAGLTTNTDDLILNAESSLKIFPNPTNGPLQVSIPENWQGQKVELNVLSLQGQVLFRSTLNHPTNSGLDLSALPSGSYILQLRNTAGKVLHGHFVVSR